MALTGFEIGKNGKSFSHCFWQFGEVVDGGWRGGQPGKRKDALHRNRLPPSGGKMEQCSAGGSGEIIN